ncbi:hypothetical protein SAMN02990966_01730 [Rhodospirillales bacterium URHD0017]|nr:hypothetical protein SAMN02990966_01730 [Rhodospirillales bacterium URHD0017]
MAIPSAESAFAPGASARRRLAASLRQAPSPLLLLLVLSGLPVLAAAWAVLSPPVMLSKAMTQDLLFNLSGAWHVYSGHLAHVDFHDASGRLSFLLTALGFHLLGPTPFAFLVNVGIMGAVLFAASFLAAMRRLPLLPAVLFVIFASLLALMPANVGDRPEQYTFAMSYNRYGWSAYSILALILFVPPREERDRTWIDIAVAGGLLAAMFYLKITYFAAGLATLGFAVLFHPHVGRYWRAWLVVGALLVLNALAPHNQAYLADILSWATSGAVRKAATLHFNNFVAAIDRYGPYLAAVAVGLWMWWSGRATFRLPLTLVFLLVMSLLLLSQNSQAAGMPSAIVVLFALYDRLRTAFASLGNRDVAPWLLTLLLFPLFAVGGYATSIAGYHANARDGRGVHVVERTNLRGLAVPEGPRGTFLSFSHSFDYPSRPKDAPAQPLYQLSDYEYVLVLMEGADLLMDRPIGGIALLDSVNPLSFMLGVEPVRGANLWSTWSAPKRSAGEFLGGARYVLVPKFATSPQWTDDMMRLYGGYLEQHFRWAAETRCWTLFVRSDPELPTSTSQGHI